MHVGSAALASDSKLLAAMISNFIEGTMQKRMCAAQDTKDTAVSNRKNCWDVSFHW
jgi:hypothetical protein